MLKTRHQTTPNGFTLDKAIQVGVDNPGVPWQRASGIVAGDRESYEVFAPLFDEIIQEYHGHGKNDFHSRDLDSRKIVGGQLNRSYVLSVRLHTRRSIQGYSLPAGCSRGERRNLEDLIRRVFRRLGGEWRQGEGHYRVFLCKDRSCSSLQSRELSTVLDILWNTEVAALNKSLKDRFKHTGKNKGSDKMLFLQFALGCSQILPICTFRVTSIAITHILCS